MTAILTLVGLAILGLAACTGLEWRQALKPLPRRTRLPLRHVAAMFFLAVLLAAWFVESHRQLSAEESPRPIPPAASPAPARS